MARSRALLALGITVASGGCAPVARPPERVRADSPAALERKRQAARALPQESTLRLGCNEWPPYVLGPGSLHEGFAVDLTREALKRMGWRLEFRNRPWARCLQEMPRGELDGVLCAYRAPGRDWPFGEVPLGLGPDWSGEFLILRRKGSAWRCQGPADLRSARLALVEGYAYPEPLASRLKAGDPGILLVTGDDPMTRLVEVVARGRAEGTVEQRLPLEAVLKRRPDLRDKVEEAGVLPGWRVYVALRPDFPNAEAVLRELDRRLLEVYRSPRFRAILAPYGLEPSGGAGGAPTGSGRPTRPGGQRAREWNAQSG